MAFQFSYKCFTLGVYQGTVGVSFLLSILSPTSRSPAELAIDHVTAPKSFEF